ncbi:MAG: hypothetical protein ACXV8H_09730 [Chthoniobacterales bacterium]
MKWIVRAFFVAGFLAIMGTTRWAAAQEAVMEEVRVEASFSSSLELSTNRAVDILTRRLREREDASRTLELQIANRNAVTTFLSLTRVIPIPLGSSESRVDTFLLQSYVRTDLNPSKANALFETK